MQVCKDQMWIISQEPLDPRLLPSQVQALPAGCTVLETRFADETVVQKDGKLPACTACERSGKGNSCSGANDDFARGKERSYVAALEAASARLQKKLNEARSSYMTDDILTNLPEPTYAGNTTSRPTPLPRNVSGTRKREASDVDDLVSDFGFLSVNATSRDFHGFAQVMSFARLLLSSSMMADIPRFSPAPIPPRYTAMPLIQSYLDNIYILLPFFSETELMTSMSSMYQESGRQPTSSDHWNFRMLLAIASATVSKVRGDENNLAALRHVSTALEHAEMVLHPGSMAGLQAILLLVQYSLVDPEHFNSWYLIGMASRVMVDLGLHQELSMESKVNKQNLDLRRRLFYCVYALDRSISTSLERNFNFTDDSASGVFLPASTAAPSGGAKRADSQLFLRSLEPSLFLFDIRRVQSAHYQTSWCSSRQEWPSSTSAQYIASILSDIRAWNATIPSSVSEQHKFFFDLEFLYSQILALSPSDHIQLNKMNESSKSLLFERAMQYVELMWQAVQNTSKHPFSTYIDICRIKFAGKQFLDVTWSNLDLLLSREQPNSADIQFQTGGVPYMQSQSPLDKCTKAISCIRETIEILDYAQERWGMTNLREKFEQESAVLLGRLKNRQQELTVQCMPTTATQQQRPLQQQPLQQQPLQQQPLQQQPMQQHQIQQMPTYMLNSDSNMPMQPQLPYPPQQQPLGQSFSWPLSENEADPRPPFVRSTSNEAALALPPGSQPRRSYEFLGGRRG